VFSRVQLITRKYIAGLFIQMLIVTVIAFTALSIIGVQYAFLLAMLIGLLNIIPYIGIFTALIISVLVTFATAGANHVLIVAITILCIHLLDSNFIMPKIVGSKVKLNTLSALLGLIVGELIWGITGMLLALPVIAILKVIFDRVEGLKHWGMVLGEDENVQTNKKDKIIDKIAT
jgi:putative permease